MSIFRQKDSLDWLSFFSVSKEEKKQILQWNQKPPTDYESNGFAKIMLGDANLLSHFLADEPATQAACEYVALNFMINDTDLAKDLLSSEDFEKAQNVFSRKQYNSKILRTLLSCFFKLLREYGIDEKLKNLFTLSILDQIKITQENEVNRSFGVLKKVIEQTAAGVKNAAYFKAERIFDVGDIHLDEELNQFVLAKTNYDFNNANNLRYGNEKSTLFLGNENNVGNSILQLALVNDVDFWSKHEKFSILVFLNEIVKQNDIRHAEKVLSFIVENLQKMPNMNLVFENNFPLYMSKYNELVESLEDQAFRFSFKRLEPYCDLTKVQSVSLCYPMSKAEPSFFEIGKKVWERFISEYNYPNDYEVVNRYLSDEINQFIAGSTHNYDDIAVILDSAPFRYSADNEDRRLFNAYHPDCFSFENIWNRVYLKAYAVTLLSDDEQTQFSYLQRIFVDLIKTVEQRIGVCTAHQLDLSTRTKYYEKLKLKLKEFDIETDDKYKEDYIVSLLDRDTAMMSETERFPELEQLGDSIYGIAVAELLFYNPQTVLPWNTEKKMAELFENFTRAEAQVLISKKHGFDKLFLHIGLPAKYVEFDTIFFDYSTAKEEHLQTLNQEKYLADLLEMIVGAICRDKGIEAAIKFAKELLIKTFPKNFSSEIRPTEENKHNTDIERDYWARILPAPYSVMEDEHRILWNALNKVVLTISLGTDDKDKRRYITNSFGNTAIYGEEDDYDVSWPFHYYFQHGLDFVLQKYSDTIREKYSKNNKF